MIPSPVTSKSTPRKFAFWPWPQLRASPTPLGAAYARTCSRWPLPSAPAPSAFTAALARARPATQRGTSRICLIRARARARVESMLQSGGRLHSSGTPSPFSSLLLPQPITSAQSPLTPAQSTSQVSATSFALQSSSQNLRAVFERSGAPLSCMNEAGCTPTHLRPHRRRRRHNSRGPDS